MPETLNRWMNSWKCEPCALDPFRIVLPLLFIFLAMSNGYAQDQQLSKSTDFPKVHFAMPFEFDFDFGAPNGNAVIGRFLPVLVVKAKSGWEYHNFTQALIAWAPGGRPGLPGNPEPIRGDQIFGSGDWVNVSLFFPKLKSDKLKLAFGPGFGIPMATNPVLGSQKWTIGPAFRIGYLAGKWNLNALLANLWSFAGNPGRNEVTQLIIRALFRRPLGEKWFFTSNPIITCNWRGASGQRWLAPLGGGIGKSFPLGKRSYSIAVHGYYNVIHPDGAPDGLVRLDFLYPLPGGKGR